MLTGVKRLLFHDLVAKELISSPLRAAACVAFLPVEGLPSARALLFLFYDEVGLPLSRLTEREHIAYKWVLADVPQYFFPAVLLPLPL